MGVSGRLVTRIVGIKYLIEQDSSQVISYLICFKITCVMILLGQLKKSVNWILTIEEEESSRHCR